jgi:predicted double-glycine peptidase
MTEDGDELMNYVTGDECYCLISFVVNYLQKCLLPSCMVHKYPIEKFQEILVGYVLLR